MLWVAGAVVSLGAAGLIWVGASKRGEETDPSALRATLPRPPGGLGEASDVGFEQIVVRSIVDHGYLSVTVHVALADHARGDLSPVPVKFGNGREPKANQYWGALYGIETHFANAAGWRRVYTDFGDGVRIIRRVVFHRRGEATARWRDLGVSEPFDVYVLANAWPSSKIASAMEQPLRDALMGDRIALGIDGRDVPFGGGSVAVGYVGQNAMLGRYWDPFTDLPSASVRGGVGVFYVCWKSAVYLHRDVVEHGLHPILFVRQQIVPEAYVVDGLLRALIEGEFEDGFLSRAAEAYATYQGGVSHQRARAMIYR